MIKIKRYDNAPVYEWDAIQEGIDLPNLQRTFAGLIIFVNIIIIIINIQYKHKYNIRGRHLWLYCQPSS